MGVVTSECKQTCLDDETINTAKKNLDEDKNKNKNKNTDFILSKKRSSRVLFCFVLFFFMNIESKYYL